MPRLHSFVLSLLFGSVVTATAQTLTVSVSNHADFACKDAPVVVDLMNYLPPNTRITSAIVTDAAGVEYDSQLDDLNGDLVADELIFTVSMPANSTAAFVATLSQTEPQRKYEPRVTAFMKLWDQKFEYPRINSIEFSGNERPLDTYNAIYGHGAMWESEYGGFRVYMDNRQSVDIYGKPRPSMVLDKTNFYSTRDDIRNGLGCDILFAGQSVGVGSFRGWLDEQTTYIDSVEARGQRIVAAGPVRSIVEVWDKNWYYRGRILQMRQRYIMYAGHRDVHFECWLQGTDDTSTFATGVQKLEMDNEGFLEQTGLAGSWGRNVPDKAAPDLIEGVGLGIRVPRPFLRETREDDTNYLCLLRPRHGFLAYDFAICASMEEEGFKSSAEWFSWLRQWDREKRNRLDVTISLLPTTEERNLHYTPATLLIFFEEAAQQDVLAAAQRYGCSILYTFRHMHGCAVRIPATKSVEESIAYFKRLTGVLQVQRDEVINVR